MTIKFKELREKYKGKYPPEMVASAVKIALDMAGAMTPATKKIEAMRRGLSNDPIVKDALRQANESVNEATFMITVPKGGPGGKDLNVKVMGKDKNDAVKQWRKKNRKYKNDEVVVKPLKEELQLNEMTQRFAFDNLKKATNAEKMADKYNLRVDSGVEGKIYYVAVTGKFTDITKWMKAID